ncbi:hypothetical protein MLD38_033427 [Melastoma candidum]|uniref:Uncharacterized protein n=1 Tax=Melastoma candidum TaxID=119954 RepID=A0ACB9M7A6_9MYRT|nr:hypothetical protein MLD38_033427 [Melastoma candidum]
MKGKERVIGIDVLWRGRRFTVEMGEGASVGDLGVELQKLADVKAETLRLIVPRVADKGSTLVQPFADEYRGMSLREISVPEGKAVRMMGVSEVEVDELLEAAKTDLRIAGFDEEEKRLRLRRTNMPHGAIKLPQGQYVFCEFRTLQLAGIELNPPPSEALRRMHMLAADPGIVAIMNKYRWRVGLMSEMAPIGYVGISPKCLLGLNKNQGEEISLRLRTDDMKGFRKYESIKRTLLHELAHMVHSEHDSNFFALNSKLNEEAISLDWTKSQGHTVNGFQHSEDLSDDYESSVVSSIPHKLGGNKSEQLASARASSVAAAYERYAFASTRIDAGSDINAGSNCLRASGTAVKRETIDVEMPSNHRADAHQSHPVVASSKQRDCEPDPDELACNAVSTNGNCDTLRFKEPNPDDLVISEQLKRRDDKNPLKPQGEAPEELLDSEMLTDRIWSITNNEQDDEGVDNSTVESLGRNLPAEGTTVSEPDPDAGEVKTLDGMQIDEPDPDDPELKRINDPVAVVCNRLRKAIKTLESQVDDTEATKVLETLVRIIRNVIEHPEEMKYRRLRKANPTIQRNITSRTAALEILNLVGFHDDVVSDEYGRAEACLVLKRNDPGLLWLAKSSLETCLV